MARTLIRPLYLLVASQFLLLILVLTHWEPWSMNPLYIQWLKLCVTRSTYVGQFFETRGPGEIRRTSTSTKPCIQTKFPRKQILPIALFKPSKYISPHLLSFPARAIFAPCQFFFIFFHSSTPAKQINHPSRWRFGAKPAWQINLPANVLLILSKESRVHSAHPSRSEWLRTYCWKPWMTVLIVNREGRTRGKKKIESWFN